MCDCDEVKRLKMLLNMERLKTKIYRQLIEQKIDVKIDDSTDDIINEGVIRKLSPIARKLSPKKITVSDLSHYTPLKIQSEKPRKFRPFPKSVDEVEVQSDGGQNVEIHLSDLVKEKFGVFDISAKKIEIKKCFESLKESRTYANILTEIKNHRIVFMTVMNIIDYTNLVIEHVLLFKKIFIERSFPEKKIMSSISKFLTPLEFHLTQSEGFEKQHVDVDEIEKLKVCLKLAVNYPKTFRCFEHSHFYTFFINYSLAFFDVKYLFEIYLSNPYGFKNIIYVHQESSEDPLGFSYYILDRVEGQKRFWKMVCRLEHIADELAAGIRNYVVPTFRKIYKTCIGNNNYLENYKARSEVLEFDCEQLLQNLFSCLDEIRFNQMFRDAVKTTSTYTATNNDKFDFIQDDKEQFINFKNHKTSEDEIMKVVQELFDDMDNSKALEFYYSVKKN
jgi:hypothetical protein